MGDWEVFDRAGRGRGPEYRVVLSESDREYLEGLTRRGSHPVRMVSRAKVLLELDARPSPSRAVIADRVGVSLNTVSNVARAFVTRGVGAVSHAAPATPRVPVKVTGDVEAHVIAMACGAPPAGRVRWTLRLLENRVHLRADLPDLDHSTIGRILADNQLRPHLNKYYVIPPKANAAFVACMEDVLGHYAAAYDPGVPLICMDEKPYQLLGHTREPVPASPGHVAKTDYEYQRNGTCSIFMFTEPHTGWRRVEAHERRTMVDWAHQVKHLLTVDYPDARTVKLVTDQLNTHTMASLYEAFDPGQAYGLMSRLEIHFTPKHGSWLNIAEIELAALDKQCLDRRIPNLETLNTELKAWQEATNADTRRVNWHFTTTDARTRLRHLYPQRLE